jgi:hypothetical protein
MFAAARASLRRKYKTFCRECQREIEGLSRLRFCSQTCQRRHWRARRKEMGPGADLPKVP